MSQTNSLPRRIDGRSSLARAARVSGAQFDINGNLTGGRDQATRAGITAPQPLSTLDAARQRLGWTTPGAPKPSRYATALAQAQPPATQPIATPANAATAKASNLLPVQKPAAQKATPDSGANAVSDEEAAQAGANVAANPAPAPVTMKDMLGHMGELLGHAGRFAGQLLGLGGSVPATSPQPQPPTAAPAGAASLSAALDPVQAMAGRFSTAGWAQPGDEVTRTGAGYQINGQSVQPTGAMQVDAWKQANNAQNLGTQARPGQRFSELGQAIMDRTSTPTGFYANSGEYVKDPATGARYRDGAYSQQPVALNADQPAAEGKGVGTASGREIVGKYGSGISRFNVADSAPGSIRDETGLVSTHVPAGALMVNDGPGGRQVVTRNGGTSEDDEEQKRRSRFGDYFS